MGVYWVLCSSARLCLVVMGTFVPSCMLLTVSGCNQALFACLRNSGEAERSGGH